jgi:hypothetical protein
MAYLAASGHGYKLCTPIAHEMQFSSMAFGYLASLVAVGLLF